MYVREFLSWLEDQGIKEVATITQVEILQYYEYISHRPSKQDGGILSKKYTFSQMKTLEHLFTMLLRNGEIYSHPMSTLRFEYPKTRNERKVLSQEEIKRLYKVCKDDQERAILSLAYGCGLRAGELENIHLEDVKMSESILIVPKGKGNKRRVVPMSEGVRLDLLKYYESQYPRLSEGRDYNQLDRAFMLNSRGGRMREFTFNKYLKRIVERTNDEGIKEKRISIHNLRHSIATHLLENGVPIEQVRDFLGHAELETTQVYTYISSDKLAELILEEE